MRTSRTVSQIDKTDKTIYPKCNNKKQHQKQSLNMICLTKTCKYAGPICALCKKQHHGHNIVPIKNFLSSVSESHKKLSIRNNKIEEKLQIEENLQIEQKQHKSINQRLQESFNQIMSMLNYQVQELSEQIKRTEQKLIEQFQKVKTQLQQEGRKQQLIQESLGYFNKKQFNDSLQFRKNINNILKHMVINKNDFSVPAKEQQIVKNYQIKTHLYKDNLFIIQHQIKELYSCLHDRSMHEKVEKIVDITRPKTAIVTTLKPSNTIFSPQYKAANITIEKEGKSVKLKDNNGYKIVFLHNTLSSKVYQTTIKITNLSGIITIGVGLKDKLKLKAYKFQKTPDGHGLYGIASNNIKFNQTQKKQDNVPGGFAFGAGDQITISLKVKDKKLLFFCKNDQKKKAQLDLKLLLDPSFKQLQFCAVFTAMGDKVEII